MSKTNKRIKGILFFLVALTVILCKTPTTVNAAAALKKNDFIITYGNNKTYNFIKDSSKQSNWMSFNYEITSSTKGLTSNKKLKTSRGIKYGSPLSAVTKKYGAAQRYNETLSDGFMRQVEIMVPTLDTTKYKYYVEYKYKKYVLRFLLDKNQKVRAIIMVKNKEAFMNWDDYDAQITFKAPAGKSVTTSTICGKTVYNLPSGTRIIGNIGEYNMCQYSKSGYCSAYSQWDGGSSDRKIEDYIACCLKCNKKQEPIMKNGKTVYLKASTLGSYRFFTMRFTDPETYSKCTKTYYIRYVK